MYFEHVYTECTAERWDEQQVSNGGPRSAVIGWQNRGKAGTNDCTIVQYMCLEYTILD